MLGKETGVGKFTDWGTFNNADGTITINTNGITGKIEAFTPEGAAGVITNEHNSLGVKGKSNEIDNGEKLIISFDTEGACMRNIRIGFDSMYGNYIPGSGPDARTTWEATYKGSMARNGEFQADMNNSDGDGNNATSNFVIPGDKTDKIVISTYSPTDVHSNMVVRFLEFELSLCCGEPDDVEPSEPSEPECDPTVTTDVILGKETGVGKFEDWGTINEDGTLTINNSGITGTITAYTPTGE